ncbi:MAG TPA: hypothetical protein VIV11_18955 [Kofleriaceae bacterium]
MHDIDVRDVGGRLSRLLASIITGTMLSVVLACLIPGLKRLRGGPGDFAITALVAAGACGIAMAIYALLGTAARNKPTQLVCSKPAPLPRATLRRSKRYATRARQ